MEKQKKQYRMTARRFSMHNYTGKRAQAFIEQHRSFLDGETYLAPILSAYDCGEIDDPTIAYHTLKEALMYNDYQQSYEKAKLKLKEQIDKKPTDQYTITIYTRGTNGLEVGKRIIPRKQENPDTGIVETWEDEEDMIYNESLFYSALRKANRMLVSETNSVCADIKNNYGTVITTTITRSDAFADVYKKRIGPSMKNLAKKSAALTSRMKSKNDHARFSRG
jgi:hypothetical protein